MALARWQATIVDDAGNVVAGALVEVRRETAGTPLESLYSDRDGAVPLSNPVTADGEGFVAFHAAGGAFRIRAYATGFERIWRYVPIGTAQEADFVTSLLPRGDWDSGTTYAIGDVVSHQSGSSAVYAFASNEDSNTNNEPVFASGDVPESDQYWTLLGIVFQSTSGFQPSVIVADLTARDALTVSGEAVGYSVLVTDDADLYFLTDPGTPTWSDPVRFPSAASPFVTEAGAAVTLSAGHNGKTVKLTADDPTVTLPDSLLEEFTCILMQLGSGQVSFVADGGATLQNTFGFDKTYGQYSRAVLDVIENGDGSSAVWLLAGELSN